MEYAFYLSFLLISFLSPAKNELPQRGFSSHRGANATHPENTLPAFREALSLGAQQIEQKYQFIQLLQLCSQEEMQQLKSAGVKVNFCCVQSLEHARQLLDADVDFLLVDDLGMFVESGILF